MPALKRSQINDSIDRAIREFARHHVHLPPFAFWTPEQWETKGPETDEIRNSMLGWDVTDFGSGDFERIGRTLFTLRNGRTGDSRYTKSYAEKFIFDPEGQRAPLHYHQSKREDIIHRGQSGVMVVELCPVGADNRPLMEPFTVQVDGQTTHLQPFGRVKLLPGQSVEIRPRTFHQFWAEENSGATVSGEVSSVCDDWNDNCFVEPLCRFPKIDEDEPRRYYLCHEYPQC